MKFTHADLPSEVAKIKIFLKLHFHSTDNPAQFEARQGVARTTVGSIVTISSDKMGSQALSETLDEGGALVPVP